MARSADSFTYGHVLNINVEPGQRVKRGRIVEIGQRCGDGTPIRRRRCGDGNPLWLIPGFTGSLGRLVDEVGRPAARYSYPRLSQEADGEAKKDMTYLGDPGRHQ